MSTLTQESIIKIMLIALSETLIFLGVPQKERDKARKVFGEVLIREINKLNTQN